MPDSFTPEEWEICIKVLKVLSRAPEQALDVMTLKGLVTKLYKNAKKNIRQTQQQAIRENDKQLKSQTLIYQINSANTPEDLLKISAQNFDSQSLKQAQRCYICKQPYQTLHFFYHQLCPTCAELNYAKRQQSTDLRQRTALITGGRIKIGYQTALRMLRDGAKVLLTTRFPKDCAQRFSQEPDFGDWQTRLKIYGLDLRNIPAVEQFTQYLCQTEPYLDILVNNAAQTVKRPLEFYQHLLTTENIDYQQLSPNQQKLLGLGAQTQAQLLEAKKAKLLPDYQAYFPLGELDKDRQQIDLRPQNSWVLKLAEVDTLELLEVHLVNSIAPFLLNAQLKPLFLQSPHARRFIINVSAMEGQFNREYKTPYHPHTNMAKAALNMLTRTSAQDYADNQIYMNSVDTGWITEENPFPKKNHKKKRGFVTPLDEIDGMARLYDPIVQGLTLAEMPIFGHFLKDYQPYPW
ncbi:MAG: SDR family oxidoreductase [Microscillaceae bacterium]|jgi:NAD(P)-dependent dehydrogenase (short-subunit alcohol dehydrogenase family)|nr:SDR family oxidoreductase [Microscillaceae bacterium]